MIIQEIEFANHLAEVSREQDAEELKGVLIVTYETAVERGLPPQDALAAILTWVAEECARLRAQ